MFRHGRPCTRFARRALTASLEYARLRSGAGRVLVGGGTGAARGLPGGGVNIAYEAVDRQADGPLADAVALRFLSKRRGTRRAHLRRVEARDRQFANVLADAGGANAASACSCSPGRIPELYVAALGTLKNCGVFCPLFSAFGPGADRAAAAPGGRAGAGDHDRPVSAQGGRSCARGCRASSTCCSSATATSIAEIRAPRTSRRLMRRPLRTPTIAAHRSGGHGAAAFHERHDRDAEGRGPRARGGRGPPRHRPRSRWTCTRRRVLVHRRPGLGDRDVVRDHRAADPRGDAIVDEAEFEADRWYGILRDERVTVWYTAPTALRMLMRAGAELRARVRPDARCGSSRASANRSTRRPWCGGGRRSGLPRPRQLVADRDGRDHDRQLPLDGDAAGVDGTAAARDRGGGGQA